jgi:hypothetical protein
MVVMARQLKTLIKYTKQKTVSVHKPKPRFEISSVIDESEISKILREDGVTETAAEKLKKAVYKSGAPDNITLVLAKLTDENLNSVGIIGAAAVVA